MEIHVSGDNSVFDINHDDIINEIPIIIHNDQYNPAARVFLNLPKTNSKLDMHCSISTDSISNLELILLLNNDTHIHNGSFKTFDKVMVTDHKIV